MLPVTIFWWLHFLWLLLGVGESDRKAFVLYFLKTLRSPPAASSEQTLEPGAEPNFPHCQVWELLWDVTPSLCPAEFGLVASGWSCDCAKGSQFWLEARYGRRRWGSFINILDVFYSKNTCPTVPLLPWLASEEQGNVGVRKDPIGLSHITHKRIMGLFYLLSHKKHRPSSWGLLFRRPLVSVAFHEL